MFSMASNYQFPFGIGAGGVFNGGGQPVSGPQAGGRLRPMGFHFGQGSMPQAPTLSGVAGFQHLPVQGELVVV